MGKKKAPVCSLGSDWSFFQERIGKYRNTCYLAVHCRINFASYCALTSPDAQHLNYCN